jgi:hypothetical protein
MSHPVGNLAAVAISTRSKKQRYRARYRAHRLPKSLNVFTTKSKNGKQGKGIRAGKATRVTRGCVHDMSTTKLTGVQPDVGFAKDSRE